jgi:hypothetical protein
MQNSVIVAPGLPRQDSLPRAPAGGRFPSDLNVNAARGLQVPLSPSSGSSAFGDQDHDAIAAAAGVPGSGIGEHYPQPTEGYGTHAMGPTRASELNQAAREDGVNPYTYQPVQKRDAFGSGAIEGAVIGADAHRDHVAADAPEVASPNQEVSYQSHLASVEAAQISVHDTEDAEKLAAVEAAAIAASDTNTPVNGEEPFTRGRSMGDQSKAKVSPSTFAAENTTIPAALWAPSPISPAFQAPAIESKENHININPIAGNANFSNPFAEKAVPNEVQDTAYVLPKRPNTLAEQLRAGQHSSDMSIAQLHVPGEYPRGSIS